jgi:SM-20-related protein
MGDYDEIIRLLNKQGWAISDSVIPLSWHISLLMQGWHLWERGQFEMGEIGRSASDARRPEVRGDMIYWIQPGSALAGHPFFRWMAQFRQVLNERYDLGVRSQEFHFARYGEGRGYKKHIDQHRGSDHRKISIVLYLNLQWNPMQGGELCLYEPYNPNVEIRRVSPLGARLAVFLSGVIPHAVLPCRQTRWSLAGWLRTDEPPG